MGTPVVLRPALGNESSPLGLGLPHGCLGARLHRFSIALVRLPLQVLLSCQSNFLVDQASLLCDTHDLDGSLEVQLLGIVPEPQLAVGVHLSLYLGLDLGKLDLVHALDKFHELSLIFAIAFQNLTNDMLDLFLLLSELPCLELLGHLGEGVSLLVDGCSQLTLSGSNLLT